MFAFLLFRIKLYPSIETALVNRLENSSKGVYYFRNEYARDWQIPAQTEVHRISNVLLRSYMPEFIILAFIEQASKLGNRSASNFNFETSNISSLYAKSQNLVYPLDGPFRPKIEAGDAAASNFYRSFFSLYGPSFEVKDHKFLYMHL